MTLENFLANTFYKESARPAPGRRGGVRLRPIRRLLPRAGGMAMFQGISVSLNPIEPWWLLVGAALVVRRPHALGLRAEAQGTSGRWRWVALGLRLLAVLLCLLAALRPSVILQEKKRQAASLVFLVDSSTSMIIGDEVSGQTRWAVAQKTLEQALEAAKSLGPNLEVKTYRFDTTLERAQGRRESRARAGGPGDQLGTAMLEAEKRAGPEQQADRPDGDPLRLRLEQRRQSAGRRPPPARPAGAGRHGRPRDRERRRRLARHPRPRHRRRARPSSSRTSSRSAARWWPAASPASRSTSSCFVEGQAAPVAKTQVKVPEGADVAPITGLKYIPQTPGEKKITLKVAPREGELVLSNNEISTFVTVLSGGLNVMFLQGPNFTWDYVT